MKRWSRLLAHARSLAHANTILTRQHTYKVKEGDRSGSIIKSNRKRKFLAQTSPRHSRPPTSYTLPHPPSLMLYHYQRIYNSASPRTLARAAANTPTLALRLLAAPVYSDTLCSGADGETGADGYVVLCSEIG